MFIIVVRIRNVCGSLKNTKKLKKNAWQSDN